MGKVFVITGTRKGIGRGLAEHYLSGGHTVIGCSRGAGTISHPAYDHQILDVTDEKGVVGLVRKVRSSHGRIDVLLNNAGVASMNHVLTTPYLTAQNIFGTNFFGSFLFLREVAKVMAKRDGGRIVNFSTIAVPLKLEGEALYAASKAAVESLTQVSARELAGFGITVNAIGPTPVPTDLIKAVPKDKMDALLGRQSIKSFGTVEDVINVVDFFIDEKSKFITGQVIYLGGVSR